MTSRLDQLPKKARGLAESQLAAGEDIITIWAGRSKQAMIVTDRQILIVKPGFMAGAALNAKAASFPLARISAINVHTGPGFAAIEVVVAGRPAAAKPDLRSAYQLPNWLPCHSSLGRSSLIGELRTYVQSDGRARSARAALAGPESG
ncbi:MAG: hypothetical protein M3065_10005 [Actinomycetota bacterium]|nr:hypothetical protein [Actinomycetota bacterium]